MDLKDYLLKYRKKLLAYTFITTFGVTSLTGCGSSNYSYQTSQNGEIIIQGETGYDEFVKLKLVRVTNKNADLDKYYLVKFDNDRYDQLDKYIDIETGKVIFSLDENFKDFELDIIVDNMVSYLLKYNMVKEVYNVEDIEILKERLLSDDTLMDARDVNKKVLIRNSDDRIKSNY